MKKKVNFKFIFFALLECMILGIAGAAAPAMADNSQTNSNTGFLGKYLGNSNNFTNSNRLEKQLEEGTITQEQYNGMQEVQKETTKVLKKNQY